MYHRFPKSENIRCRVEFEVCESLLLLLRLECSHPSGIYTWAEKEQGNTTAGKRIPESENLPEDVNPS